MNRGNTAVKRILADVKELQQHPSSRYYAEPTEDNMFEWHFTIRGPVGTDFEGGIYHGRILLPAEYPFKPPNIVFLTKNGRFETGTKICLSISAYHPEHWQPAWGVRTMLEAIISFLPTEGQGAIGALDWTPRERKKLAVESVAFTCPVCGEVRDLLTEYDEKEEGEAGAEMAAQISQLHVHGIGKVAAGGGGEDDPRDCKDDEATGASSIKVAAAGTEGGEAVCVPGEISKGGGVEAESATESTESSRGEGNSDNQPSQRTINNTGAITTHEATVLRPESVTEAGVAAAGAETPPVPQGPPAVRRNTGVVRNVQRQNNTGNNDDIVDKLLVFALVCLGLLIGGIVVLKNSNLFGNSTNGNGEL